MRIHSQELNFRSPRLAAIVAAGGLALAGCGSGERESVSASKPAATEQSQPIEANPNTPVETTETIQKPEPVKEIAATEADPMIVDLLCDLKIGYQGISYDKTVAEAFTKAATDSLVKGIVTEDEFRAAAPLADYYTQSPSGDGYSQPITPDTILPHSEGYRAEFSKNC